jgi:di/tripeptidase
MSMDTPNEDEKAIEAYAAAVRAEKAAAAAYDAALKRRDETRDRRQELWREVKARTTIPHGIYRLKSSTHYDWAEGLLIGSGDYPDVLPMFR